MTAPRSTLEAETEFVLDGTHGSPKRTDRGVPVLSAQHVKNGRLSLETSRFTTHDEYAAFAKRLSPQRGDLLLTIVGTIGRAAVLEETPPPLVFQRSVSVIRPKDHRLDPRFLYYVTQSDDFRRQLDRFTNKSSQAGVYLNRLKTAVIPLPPLAEQKRIAAILDAADALRAKRREALAQLDTLLQSTFLDMFGDPVTNPMSWPVVDVGDEIRFLTSGSRGWAKYYSDRGDTFIRIQNLRGGRLDLSDIAFVRAPESAEARRTRVEPGDVLLSITADLGRTAVVPPVIGKAHINQHLSILRFKDLDPIFVSHQLASAAGQVQFARLNREGVKAGLNFNDIRSLQLTKPPVNLQHRFADVVRSLEGQRAYQLNHLAELDTLFASLQQRAFRGDL